MLLSMTLPDDEGLNEDEKPKEPLNADDILKDIERMLSAANVDEKKITIAQRRRLIFQLRAEGRTIQQIATALGLSWSIVQRDSARAVADIDVTKYLDAELTYDLQRIESLISAYWDRAVRGDLNAAKFINEMLARKHKLLGMEAPKRVDIRALIATWAQAKGLGESVQDVIEAAYEILPEAD